MKTSLVFVLLAVACTIAFYCGRMAGDREATFSAHRYDALLHISALANIRSGDVSKAAHVIELMLDGDAFELARLRRLALAPRGRLIDDTLSDFAKYRAEYGSKHSGWPIIDIPDATNDLTIDVGRVEEMNTFRQDMNETVRSVMEKYRATKSDSAN